MSMTTAPTATRPLRHSAGFVAVPNHLFDQGVFAALKPSALKVLLAMLRLADASGRCWPSVESLAGRGGLSLGGAKSGVRQLVESGLIRRERPGRKGRATLYRLCLPQAEPGPHRHASWWYGKDERPCAHDGERHFARERNPFRPFRSNRRANSGHKDAHHSNP